MGKTKQAAQVAVLKYKVKQLELLLSNHDGLLDHLGGKFSEMLDKFSQIGAAVTALQKGEETPNQLGFQQLETNEHEERND